MNNKESYKSDSYIIDNLIKEYLRSCVENIEINNINAIDLLKNKNRSILRSFFNNKTPVKIIILNIKIRLRRKKYFFYNTFSRTARNQTSGRALWAICLSKYRCLFKCFHMGIKKWNRSNYLCILIKCLRKLSKSTFF